MQLIVGLTEMSRWPADAGYQRLYDNIRPSYNENRSADGYEGRLRRRSVKLEAGCRVGCHPGEDDTQSRPRLSYVIHQHKEVLHGFNSDPAPGRKKDSILFRDSTG